MRTGPALFSFYEDEEGRLATGACQFSLDRALIDRARAAAVAAGTVSEPTTATAADPAIAPAEPDSSRPLLLAAVAVAAVGVGALAVFLARRRRLT